jgi:DNA-binding NtrC family response regulator
MTSEITAPVTPTRSCGERPPDEPINTVLDSHASNVFKHYVKKKRTTASALLNEIIHAWAAHPARSEGVVALPAETSVVYHNESLAHYLTRVSISAIEAVLKSKNGNFSDAARSLQCDRSALHHRLKRLTTATQGLTSFQCTDRTHTNTNENFPPLSIVKRDYINQVIRHCEGNQTKAATILGIHVDQLRKELKSLGASNGKSIS